MKGLVFTTFFEFCESRYGADMLDDIIVVSNVRGGGAYTSVGTYPFEDMVALLTALVAASGKDLKSLLEDFGQFCFAKWVNYSPSHFANTNLFEVLANIDHFHETEVRKLYPDAELPSFRIERRDSEVLYLRYYSCKPLADLAVGVINGASQHLADPVIISYQTVADRDAPYVRFTIARVH